MSDTHVLRIGYRQFRCEPHNAICDGRGLVMLDIASARLRTHRNNIARYRRLLETKLTELEREYIQRRLSEEQSNLEALGSVASAFDPQCPKIAKAS
jgi:hypothetical protein